MLTYDDIKIGSILSKNIEQGPQVLILILTTPENSIVSGYHVAKVMHLTKDRYGLIQDRYLIYNEGIKGPPNYWNVLC